MGWKISFERLIPNPAGAGECDERQGQPFPDDRNVPGSKKRKRVGFHQPNIGRHSGGMVAGP